MSRIATIGVANAARSAEDFWRADDPLKGLSTAGVGVAGGGKQPGNTWSQQFDPAANRLVTGGASYDANGNMTAIPGMSGLQYDWENRLPATPEASYFYDHNNRRIWKKDTATGAGQVMFYGLSGELRAIYNLTKTASPATLTLTLAKRYFSFGTMRFENDRLGSVTARATTPVNHYPYRRQASLCHLRPGHQRSRRCPEPVLFERNAGAVPDAGSVPGKRRPSVPCAKGNRGQLWTSRPGRVWGGLLRRERFWHVDGPGRGLPNDSLGRTGAKSIMQFPGSSPLWPRPLAGGLLPAPGLPEGRLL